MVQKLLSGILIYYYFNNMRVNYNSGFTLIEAMAVIVIIGLISVFFVINMKPDTIALLKMDTTRLAADIRYIRSMAATRATHNGSYPTEGYGIFFKNGNGTTIKSYYELKAGSDLLKTVYLSSTAFRLVDPNLEYPGAIVYTDKYFKFITENFVRTDLREGASGDYKIDIYYPFKNVAGQDIYYKSQINIGQKTSDEFTWSNLSTVYETNQPICGNDVVELGEQCEPIEEGVINLNCRPDCKTNICGDGYVLGTEVCDKSPDFPDNFEGICSNLTWRYTCRELNAIGCESGDCCPNYPDRSCEDCRWAKKPYTCDPFIRE